jgi:phage gp36-like protein
MPYCSLDDIKKAIPEQNLIQLTDDAGEGVIDDVKIDDAIAYAGQLIDGYLRGRYTVPLQPVPELVKRLAVDLAVFHLYSRRFELDMPQTMVDRRKEIIRLLEQIQQGKVLLGIETADSPGQGYYMTNKTAEDRIFSKTHLEQF